MEIEESVEDELVFLEDVGGRSGEETVVDPGACSMESADIG